MSQSSSAQFPAGYLEWGAQRTVHEAAAAARLLGVVFAVLGGVLLAPMLRRGNARGYEVWGIVNVVVLVGPGVWYFLAASWLRRLDRRAATVSLRIAAVQFAAVALGLLFRGTLGNNRLSDVAMPAVLAVFFMPALAALVYHLVRARSAMNLIQSEGSAFEPIVRPVLPLDPATAPDPDSPPATGMLIDPLLPPADTDGPGMDEPATNPT
jgi:hypothetical protein